MQNLEKYWIKSLFLKEFATQVMDHILHDLRALGQVILMVKGKLKWKVVDMVHFHALHQNLYFLSVYEDLLQGGVEAEEVAQSAQQGEVEVQFPQKEGEESFDLSCIGPMGFGATDSSNQQL